LSTSVERAAKRSYDAIEPDDGQGEPPLFPLVNRYTPMGSTTEVDFTTTRPCYTAVKSHINEVVLDTSTEDANWRGGVGEIQIDPYSLTRGVEQGISEEEIGDATNTGFAIPRKDGRVGIWEVDDFRQTRHGRYYEQRRVEVFYTIEQHTIITVTVYVLYGWWE
jgi:hypothetical protein